jgi:hypothetical protein
MRYLTGQCCRLLSSAILESGPAFRVGADTVPMYPICCSFVSVLLCHLRHCFFSFLAGAGRTQFQHFGGPQCQHWRRGRRGDCGHRLATTPDSVWEPHYTFSFSLYILFSFLRGAGVIAATGSRQRRTRYGASSSSAHMFYIYVLLLVNLCSFLFLFFFLCLFFSSCF